MIEYTFETMRTSQAGVCLRVNAAFRRLCAASDPFLVTTPDETIASINAAKAIAEQRLLAAARDAVQFARDAEATVEELTRPKTGD